MDGNKSICVNRLVKTYGATRVLDEISFEVDKGELFGLIGPDGAGKTSIFRILTTLLLADSGTASVDGFDVVGEFQQIRNRVGYMPGRFSLYQDLTITENLEFFATVFGTTVRENYDMIKDIYEQIEPFRHRRAGQLSGGMKQKLALCCALIHRPEVLFLDEPTTGVDVVSRKEFWDILYRLREQHMTIMVSTPYMDEAKLCDRIALIQKGRIMQVDEPGKITASFPKKLFAVTASHQQQLLRALKADREVESCHAFGEAGHVTLWDPDSDLRQMTAIVERYGIPDVEVKHVQPGIEDSFIRLMDEETNGSLK
ncbi:ABC transporter ATP-binding protein [Nubsella zeaxanthinifaciens]|uniref:ABC transporter ATP-binding protein n=1 Tax=Nubsella zeaxanthinifaciens TaxID=392412 RepID=UPI003CFC4A0A